MNRLQNIGMVSLCLLALTIVSHAETLGFFGLAPKENSARTDKLLMPLLPKGLGEVQFGDTRAEVLGKRQSAETEKQISDGTLMEETVPADRRVIGVLNIFNVRFGYDEGMGAGGRGLDSVRLAGYYDDKTGKFEHTKDLISAGFLALGTPSQVISIDAYGSDRVPTLHIYWDAGKCPVWLSVSGSVTRERMNVFLVAELPRRDVKHGPRPEGRRIDRPSAADFKRIYDQWIIERFKAKD